MRPVRRLHERILILFEEFRDYGLGDAVDKAEGDGHHTVADIPGIGVFFIHRITE